jgi:hypothetical protein
VINLAKHSRRFASLRETGAILGKPPSLRVKKVSKKLRDHHAWNALRDYDVIVGTPACLSSEFASVASPPSDFADLIIVDEAHHTAARSWRTLLDDLGGARHVLFTATPFRRDDNALPGRVVYDYPMALAITEHVYAPIKFSAVNWIPGSDLDQTLADEAKIRFGAQSQLGRSAFIARAGDIKHAERLVAVYERAGLKITVVHSNLSLTEVRKRIESLRAGEVDGVAMVGILGEGFDFPTLKLAVYHERHKSLPATLQFVGRIARVQQESNAIQPELLARRETVRDETSELFTHDADWAKLLPEISARLIANVEARSSYIDEFRGLKRAPLDLRAVYPSKTVEIYNCGKQPDLGAAIKRLPNMRLVVAQPDRRKELLVVIGEARLRPRWVHSSALDSTCFELFVLVHDKKRKRLFVIGDARRALAALMKIVGADDATLVEPQHLKTVLAHHSVTRFNAVGMRNAQGGQSGAPTYKTSFAKSAGEALLPAEQQNFGVGHLSGVYGSPGSGGQIGVTVKRGKIYTPESDDLLSLKGWCLGISAMIDQPRSGSNLPLRIQFPTTVTEFPALAFAAIFDEDLVGRELSIVLLRTDGSGTVLVHQRDIDLAVKVAPDRKTCILRIEAADAISFECVLDTAGNITANEEPPLAILDGEEYSTVEVLNEFPVVIYFSDGSSFTRRLFYPMSGAQERFPENRSIAWDWSGVNIRRETDADRRPRAQRGTPLPPATKSTIHTRVEHFFAKNEPGSILIKDDGSGEIADHIRISVDHDNVDVLFVHSKFSTADTAGRRLDDLNEVVCQTMRSRRRVYGRTLFEDLRSRLGNRNYTSVVQTGGNDVNALVTKWCDTPPVATFSEWIVQPGISRARLATWDDGSILLQRCSESLAQAHVSLTLICSV